MISLGLWCPLTVFQAQLLIVDGKAQTLEALNARKREEFVEVAVFCVLFFSSLSSFSPPPLQERLQLQIQVRDLQEKLVAQLPLSSSRKCPGMPINKNKAKQAALERPLSTEQASYLILMRRKKRRRSNSRPRSKREERLRVSTSEHATSFSTSSKSGMRSRSYKQR